MNQSVKRVIPAIVSIVMFMEFLDSTIINTAIPSIARSFSADPILLKFAVTSYFLSLAIFTPVSGWCADKFGTRKIFLFSVSLFVFSSFLCAISKSIPELTCARFLQGMGGAFMNPVCRILVIRLFLPSELVRVQGYIFTPAMLGFILGPFAGGIISTYLHWSWIFYVNLPIGLAVIYFGYRFIPQQKEEHLKKFDLLGFILSAGSLGSFSFCIDMIGHYEIFPKRFVVLAGVIGVSLFIILIFHCLNKKHPILDFLILKIKTFRVGLSSCLTLYMVMASITFILPLMYQEQFGYSPLHSGFLVLPIAFGQLIFRSLATRIINKLGFKTSMLASALLIVFSLCLIVQIHLNTPLYFIIFAEFIFGASMIIHFSSTGALIYIDVPKEATSRATALDLTSRQFFSSLGVGLSALFINFLRHHFSLELSSAGGIRIFHNTFILMAVIALFSLFHVLQLGRAEGNHALKKY